MSSPLRRRIEALERSGFAVTMIVDGHGAEAFSAFIAETFDRDHGSYANAAARLFGLPAARHFIDLCKARFDSDVHAQIARQAYGEDWQRRCADTADAASARCRAVHGNDWPRILGDRLGSGKRVSRYQHRRITSPENLPLRGSGRC